MLGAARPKAFVDVDEVPKAKPFAGLVVPAPVPVPVPKVKPVVDDADENEFTGIDLELSSVEDC